MGLELFSLKPTSFCSPRPLSKSRCLQCSSVGSAHKLVEVRDSLCGTALLLHKLKLQSMVASTSGCKVCSQHLLLSHDLVLLLWEGMGGPPDLLRLLADSFLLVTDLRRRSLSCQGACLFFHSIPLIDVGCHLLQIFHCLQSQSGGSEPCHWSSLSLSFAASASGY